MLIGPHGESLTKNGVRVCRGCGCTDLNACQIEVTTPEGPAIVGCAWVLLDIGAPSGVCSSCAEALGWQPRLLAMVGLEDIDDAA